MRNDLHRKLHRDSLDDGSRAGDLDTSFMDSILRCLFTPNYFFHHPGESEYVYPLFALEREFTRREPRLQSERLLLQGARVLARFGRQATCIYLSSVFGLTVDEELLDNRTDVKLFIGHDTFDFRDPIEHKRFVDHEPVPVNGSYGIRTETKPIVLVLGTYFPFTEEYCRAIFDDPVTPEERLANGEPLSEIEKTLLIGNHIRELGFEVLTPKTDGRDMDNAFERVLHLMEISERIVLTLCWAGMGTAMEYGAICARDDLARKTLVLVPRGEYISILAMRGTFLRPSPVTAWYADASELLGSLEEFLRAD